MRTILFIKQILLILAVNIFIKKVRKNKNKKHLQNIASEISVANIKKSFAFFGLINFALKYLLYK